MMTVRTSLLKATASRASSSRGNCVRRKRMLHLQLELCRVVFIIITSFPPNAFFALGRLSPKTTMPARSPSRYSTIRSSPFCSGASDLSLWLQSYVFRTSHVSRDTRDQGKESGHTNGSGYTYPDLTWHAAIAGARFKTADEEGAANRPRLLRVLNIFAPRLTSYNVCNWNVWFENKFFAIVTCGRCSMCAIHRWR